MGWWRQIRRLAAQGRRQCRQGWALLRQVCGDDAYERYLYHQRLHHPTEPPLDRKAFFQREQDRKWNGVKRCC